MSHARHASKAGVAMTVWEPGFTYEVSGDTAVDITTPTGVRSSIRYVGLGHGWHTIHDGRGRLSTPTEYGLAQALIAANEQRRLERHA